MTTPNINYSPITQSNYDSLLLQFMSVAEGGDRPHPSVATVVQSGDPIQVIKLLAGMN